MRKPKGIFCLEGDWWNNLKKLSSVEPILNLLSKADGYVVPYIHWNIGDGDSFRNYVKKWTQKQYADHPILYLAFHGVQGGISVGDGRMVGNTVELDELGELLKNRCKRRIIFFGCCDTVAIHGKRLNSFLKKTGCLAVCGYSGDVNWLLATAFELIVLAAIQEFSLTRPGAKAMQSRIMNRAKSLAKDLNFRMVVRS